jgi:hypothetical protein
MVSVMSVKFASRRAEYHAASSESTTTMAQGCLAPLTFAGRRLSCEKHAQTELTMGLLVDGSAGPSGEAGFKAEPGRYHLYVSLACP